MMVVKWSGKGWSKTTCEPPRIYPSPWRAVYNEGRSLLSGCHLPSTSSNKYFHAHLGHQNYHRYSQLTKPHLSTNIPTDPSDWALFHYFTMHFWIAVVLPFFAASTLGATVFGGITSGLLAQPLVNGTRVTKDLEINRAKARNVW